MSDDCEPIPPFRKERFSNQDCVTAINGGRMGKGRVEIAAQLNIPLKKLQAWEVRFSSFKEALAKARDLELAWWERQAREGVSQGRNFNAALWTRCMAARFPEHNYGDAEPAIAAQPIDARDRAKAVAALLSTLQADESDEAITAAKTDGF